jgi:DNA-binding FadR family transcriptional regulator
VSSLRRHQAVARAFRPQIAAGSIGADRRLPTEADFAAEHWVARTMLRHAPSVLATCKPLRDLPGAALGDARLLTKGYSSHVDKLG